MKPEKYCKDIVKKSGSNFYYSFFFLPKRKRRAIYAVYAFSRTIDDIVDEENDQSVKEHLLAFWRNEIESVYEGYSENPLTHELVYASREFDIPKEYFVEHMNGVTQDMIQTRYATYDDLKKYCYRVASVVGLMCTKIFEVEDTPKNTEAAVNLGLAFQLTNILRDVASDAERGRIYIPEEDLLRFDISAEDIFCQRYGDNFIHLMEYEWERAKNIFDNARSGFERTSGRKILPAMIMADIYYEILLKIKEQGYHVFGEKIRIPNKQKMRLALKRFWNSI